MSDDHSRAIHLLQLYSDRQFWDIPNLGDLTFCILFRTVAIACCELCSLKLIALFSSTHGCFYRFLCAVIHWLGLPTALIRTFFIWGSGSIWMSRPDTAGCGLWKWPGSFIIRSHYHDSQYYCMAKLDLDLVALAAVVLTQRLDWYCRNTVSEVVMSLHVMCVLLVSWWISSAIMQDRKDVYGVTNATLRQQYRSIINVTPFTYPFRRLSFATKKLASLKRNIDISSWSKWKGIQCTQ